MTVLTTILQFAASGFYSQDKTQSDKQVLKKHRATFEKHVPSTRPHTMHRVITWRRGNCPIGPALITSLRTDCRTLRYPETDPKRWSPAVMNFITTELWMTGRFPRRQTTMLVNALPLRHDSVRHPCSRAETRPYFYSKWRPLKPSATAISHSLLHTVSHS
jgi:hypothetical protein